MKKPATKPKASGFNARQAIGEVQGQVAEIGGKVDQLADIVSTLANSVASRHTQPVTGNRYVESDDMDNGEANTETEHQAHVEIEIPSCADPNSPEFNEKQTKEAFLREKVQVHIHTTSDEQADQVFNIFVNGEPFRLVRGKTHTLPRYAVEGLARAKPFAMRSIEAKNDEGLTAYRYKASQGHRYGFALVNPSVQDQAWIERVMREP